jgi:hypothetical protein
VLAETQDSVLYGLLKKEWNDTEITYSLDSRTPSSSEGQTFNNLWSRAKLVAANLRILLATLLDR